jgi:hypothetical protein
MPDPPQPDPPAEPEEEGDDITEETEAEVGDPAEDEPEA